MAPEVKLNPPFRAEHIGSLLRPRELKEAFAKRSEIGAVRYREILERCIVDAIRMQEDAGLQSITDGEFRRVRAISRHFDSCQRTSSFASAW